MELATLLNDTVWLDDIIGNGYKVFVSPAAYNDMYSPMGAPHGAETFIKVTPTKHVLSQNCHPNGSPKINDGFVDDPEGYSCTYQGVVDQIENMCYVMWLL